MREDGRGGPLAGLRILEFESIGPGPYCGMLLADLGAEVLRIARPATDRGAFIADTGGLVLNRGKRELGLNLKNPADLALARDLAARADGVIEGLRPGVMERLGLGPEPMIAANPRLVYLRITGWGQAGPWANTAGHDITYIALSGALGAMGPADRPPPPPLNLVGDFGGGGLYAAFGMLAALIEAKTTGQGQVVDAAMLDGAASQMAMIYSFAATGFWRDRRESNFLDGAAPFYRCYTCACGGYVAVGAIEPQFFAALMAGLGLEASAWDQADRTQWPALAEALAARFAARSRDDWADAFDGTDACVAPVLSLGEAAAHRHNADRGTFLTDPAAPAPGPRFSGHPQAKPSPACQIGQAEARSRWGIPE